MTVSSDAAMSATRHAIVPLLDSAAQSGGRSPPEGTRPSDGLKPDSPHSADGMRNDPPPSLPVASGTMPAAIAAADPPDDPPGLLDASHGLRVVPNRGLNV